MSEAPRSGPIWHWVTENGPVEAGSERELVRRLINGELPPYTLVWRLGWGEWLPAMHVAELVIAFPGQAASTRSPRPGGAAAMPPVPVSDYPRLRLLAKESSIGVAVAYDRSASDVITSEVPEDTLMAAAKVMNEPSPPPDIIAAAQQRASGPPLDPGEASATPSRPQLPLAAEYGLQGLIDASGPKVGGWSSSLRAHGWWVALGAVILGLLTLFALRSRTPSRQSRARAETLVAPLGSRAVVGQNSTAAYDSEALLGCSIQAPPTKLDDWAVADVRPQVVLLPNERAVALGYAQSHKQATGGKLDIDTLRFERSFGQQNERQIFSVTPLLASGELDYQVERMGSLVAFSRVLDTVPPRRIGMNDAGIVLGALDRRAERVWELPLGTLISVPEIAAHEFGFTLATRAGRSTGHVLIGLLGKSGEALSRLEQLGTAGMDFGRPALASGPDQTVLAVSARRVAEAEPQAELEVAAANRYVLLMARAKNGQLPLELEPLDLMARGVDVTAPALAALPDGGFGLMWSQGAGYRRHVRAQRLSSTLVPLGPPIELSVPDPALAGATAGALYWVGDRLLAFYFLRRGEGHALWAASLACGA